MAMKFSRYISQNVKTEERILGDIRLNSNNNTFEGKGYICGYYYDEENKPVRNPDDENKTSMILSIIISNTCEEEIFVSLFTRDQEDGNNNNVYIAHSIPVASGSTTIFGSEMKLILQQGDKVYAKLDNGKSIKSTTASESTENLSCDIFMNIVEMS